MARLGQTFYPQRQHIHGRNAPYLRISSKIVSLSAMLFCVQLSLLSFCLITSYLAFWGKDRPQIFFGDRSTAIARFLYRLVTEATTLLVCKGSSQDLQQSSSLSPRLLIRLLRYQISYIICRTLLSSLARNLEFLKLSFVACFIKLP